MADSVKTPARTAWIGILLVMAGALCFSLSIIFVRQITDMPAPAIAGFRALFAFLTLSLALFRWREPLHVARYRAHIPVLLGTGVAIAVTMVLYTYAIQHTTAANAALLVNSSPLYVAIFTPWLLKEARPRWTWPSIGLALLGILLITDPASLRVDPAGLDGILAGAASGVTYALPMFAGRFLRGKVSSQTQIWWSAGVAMLVLAPFALQTPPAIIGANLPYLVLLGIISMGLSYLLLFMGLQRVSAQVASIAALFEPVSGMAIGLLIYAEAFTPLGAVGSGLVLLSIWLISRE